jgi:hypothetical protein
MMEWRRFAALALVSALLAGGARMMSAQEITIRVIPSSDSISPAPVIEVQGTPVPVVSQPSTVTLELSRESLFRSPFLVRNASGSAASFGVDSLLPERTKVYFRARVIDATGVVREQKVDSFPVRSWLRLVDPVAPSNNVVFSNKPRFVWSSPAITLPPGPWQYVIEIINTRTGQVDRQNAVNDTSFVPTTPLDACTSYRWRVSARAANGGPNDQVTITAPGTFVIQSPECPSLTLFYQNFPNPFGRGALSTSTCFWFDLAHRSTVTLTIYDIRLHEVRKIVPAQTGLATQLDSGAYGRQLNSQAGCDPRLAWDGTDDRQRPVPPGVYIAVFVADGVRSSKKILYKGP